MHTILSPLRSMPNTNTPLNSLILTPLRTTPLHPRPMSHTNPILHNLPLTPTFKTTRLPLCTVLDAHSTLDNLIGTPFDAASFDDCSMTDADALIDDLAGAPFYGAACFLLVASPMRLELL
eukprot:scaffold7538_cov235-Skeletonema_marinoi.AAC.4